MALVDARWIKERNKLDKDLEEERKGYSIMESLWS